MGEERSALFYFTPVHWSIDIFHERIADIVPRIIYTINRFEKERNEIEEFTMARSNNLQIVVVVVWGEVWLAGRVISVGFSKKKCHSGANMEVK